MPAIFISYRKDDTPGAAAHLFKNLAEAFGPGSVVMDVGRGEPGPDARRVIDAQVAGTAVMLVVIGKTWLDARDDAGQRCLENPLDLVRLETASALELKHPVIPVLVHGAAMVQPADLPPELADLALRNPVTLTQSQWGSDVETLVSLLQGLLQGWAPAAPSAAAGLATGAQGQAATPRERIVRPTPVGKTPWRGMLAGLGLIVVAALGVYALMVSRPPPDRMAAKQPPTATSGGGQAVAARADLPPTPMKPMTPTPPDAARAEPPSAAKPSSIVATGPAAAAAAAAAAEATSANTARTDVEAARKVGELKAAELKSAQGKAAEPKTAPVAKAELPAAPQAPTTAPLPSAPTGAARVLNFQKWTLNAGGCGAGPVTVTGTARFSVEKTSDAIVVTEEFRGSGGGFDVVVTGQVEFSREQTSYDIPTSGQWTGSARTFKTAGTDRVTTPDGITPKGASVVKFLSLCG